MRTITERTDYTTTTASAYNNYSGPGALIRQINSERIILFVGKFHAEIPEEEAVGCKNIYVEDFESATHMVEDLITDYGRIPSLIVVKFQSNFENDLKAWDKYFDQHAMFRSIPFFVYNEQISANIKDWCKRYTFIDEVVSRKCFKDGITAKIDFVNKYKKMLAYNKPVEAPVQMPMESPKRTINLMLKRGLDILVAGTALLVAAPVMGIIALIIRLESKGPIFYAARRAGRNYQVFKFYKFRTMVVDADKQLQKLTHLNQYGAGDSKTVFYKVSNDPRITRFGAFLRNSSLDELPQLVNVLKGDMSLVGNRPLPLYEAAALTTDDWARRFMAPAGITGLWQISKRGKKDMSVEERIELDIDYSQRNSFAYDFWIMLNTPKALVQKDNV